MTEWKLVSEGSEIFKCDKCGKESKVRFSTKKKLCKGCGCVWLRVG